MDTNSGTLKLRAEDKVDLEVMSSCLQDALLPVAALVYNQDDHTFALMADRFCWEKHPESVKGNPLYQRVHTVLCFQGVQSVRHKGIDRSDPAKILELLDITANDNAEVLLHFSGGSKISLKVDAITCHMQDVEDAWWTPNCPQHREVSE